MKIVTENRSKEKFMAVPIERHDSAAWRMQTESVKPESNVPIPSEEAVIEAKEWVDMNSLT